jgi:hypothetical protein
MGAAQLGGFYHMHAAAAEKGVQPSQRLVLPEGKGAAARALPRVGFLQTKTELHTLGGQIRKRKYESKPLTHLV